MKIFRNALLPMLALAFVFAGLVACSKKNVSLAGTRYDYPSKDVGGVFPRYTQALIFV